MKKIEGVCGINEMRCFGFYNNQQLCDMCARIDLKYYNECIFQTSEREKKHNEYLKKIDYIESHCVHRIDTIDRDYCDYYGCKLKGFDGNDYYSCYPTDDCLQYCGKKKLVKD